MNYLQYILETASKRVIVARRTDKASQSWALFEGSFLLDENNCFWL